MARYENVLETIGNTPLIRLQKMAPPDVNVYVKVESFNPAGSIKDRMAKAIIEHAEQSGELAPGQTVIEATSGNTGIGLAMVCAQKGYPLVVTMAESFSVERRKLLRFLGARVILTPASDKGTGMLNKALELADKHGYFFSRQFENELNAEIHEKTTAQEIIADFEGETLDYWVTGFGTGGTLKGVATAFRSARPGTKVIVAEPNNSQILGSGIPQPRDRAGKPSSSHPNFRPHLMQGWSPDFISKLTEDAVSTGLIDEIIPVDGNESLRLTRDLAQQEGIFAGTSSGATLQAALIVAQRSVPGTNIVCMLPDTGERYLSTPLFDDISEEMSSAEIELSRSTPGYRFDLPGNGAPATQFADADTEARQLVDQLIREETVVLFALEWCEFCWSVRKLFNRMHVPYTAIDLDSVVYQKGDLGTRIRAVLLEKLDSPTIPQVFVAGRYIGGCTEVFDAMQEGSLQSMLQEQNIEFGEFDFNPEDLLPKWMQPRQEVQASSESQP